VRVGESAAVLANKLQKKVRAPVRDLKLTPDSTSNPQKSRCYRTGFRGFGGNLQLLLSGSCQLQNCDDEESLRIVIVPVKLSVRWLFITEL
jgi:hypothetical protein